MQEIRVKIIVCHKHTENLQEILGKNMPKYAKRNVLKYSKNMLFLIIFKENGNLLENIKDKSKIMVK